MMLMKIMPLLLLLCSACGKPDNHPVEPDPVPAQVAQTRELYKLAHADGAPIEVDTCDSGHWYFLLGAAEDTLPVNPRLYMDADQKVHRRPTAEPECYKNGSDSSVSQDELLYLLAYGVARRDLQLLKDVFAYGKANDWVMGDGDVFRTFMRPSLRGLYARAIFWLGGPDFLERFIPNPEGFVQTDYEAQLQVVSILVDSKVSGGATEEFLETLRKQRERQPRNPLFACAAAKYGVDDMARAYDALNDAAVFPHDHLPTRHLNRCESWITQRDDGPDWLPCPNDRDGNPQPERVHSGGDFLFSLAVCNGRF